MMRRRKDRLRKRAGRRQMLGKRRVSFEHRSLEMPKGGDTWSFYVGLFCDGSSYIHKALWLRLSRRSVFEVHLPGSAASFPQILSGYPQRRPAACATERILCSESDKFPILNILADVRVHGLNHGRRRPRLQTNAGSTGRYIRTRIRRQVVPPLRAMV